MFTIARNIQEAFFRAFPALAGGVAPQFQNVLQYTVIALIEKHLPVTAAAKLLSHKAFREQVLSACSHEPTLAFFHDRYDRWGKDQALMVESTLNKIDLFAFTDHLRYALCQRENLLAFRRMLDEGISVIFNLGGPTVDEETQRLIGCLVTVGFEQAALSRGDLPPEQRLPYVLIIDEFASFATANGETYAKLLSQARKFNVFLWLAHQTLAQLPEGLQTAVQNTGMAMHFGIGAIDALQVAKHISHYTDEIKHEVADPQQQDRTHPVFRSIQEQERQLAARLHNQWPQEAILTLRRQPHALLKRFLRPYKTVHLRTLTVPNRTCSNDAIQQVKDAYARQLLHTREEVEHEQAMVADHLERGTRGKLTNEIAFHLEHPC